MELEGEKTAVELRRRLRAGVALLCLTSSSQSSPHGNLLRVIGTLDVIQNSCLVPDR